MSSVYIYVCMYILYVLDVYIHTVLHVNMSVQQFFLEIREVRCDCVVYLSMFLFIKRNFPCPCTCMSYCQLYSL
jgi:hypothetical protein